MAAMRWSAADLRGTAAAVEEWWELLTAGVPTRVVRELRPVGAVVATRDDVEVALAALSDAGREVHARGYGAPGATGRVAGIFVSDGGVPKLPVPAAAVDARGVAGDRQAKRKYHGRVWQALSLWSAEVVTALQAEGHPVAPGAAGENLSLAGLDWSTLRPGVRLQIGGVLAEISMPVTPCKQIAGCFADGNPWRIGHRRHPEMTRWYASVVIPGRVAAGDAVVVEP
jgi:hypothetical protein